MSHPKEIWGERFQLGGWSSFLNTSKILLTYIVSHLKPPLFSCIRCSFELNTRKLIVCFRNFSENNNFRFLFFIFGNALQGVLKVWTLQFLVWMRPWFTRKRDIVYISAHLPFSYLKAHLRLIYINHEDQNICIKGNTDYTFGWQSRNVISFAYLCLPGYIQKHELPHRR